MGLFDFLKSNKNIITDNGTNIDVVLHLTEKEIIIKKREEEINKNIKVEISKLKIIDDLISEISGIFLMVQMENSKIDYYSKLIVDKYNNNIDENYIKFYLYTKRNYFIKQLIEYNLAAAIEISESLNDINLANYYNKRFTEHIVNYFDNYLKLKSKRGIIKVNYSDSYFVKYNILRKLFVNFDVNSELIITYDGIGIDKEIFNQQSVLFGLNLNTYKLIYEIIEKKSDEFKYDINDKDNIERDEYLLEMLGGDESVINNENSRKPDQMDKYAQKIVYEILSLCNNNKVNQNNILL